MWIRKVRQRTDLAEWLTGAVVKSHHKNQGLKAKKNTPVSVLPSLSLALRGDVADHAAEWWGIARQKISYGVPARHGALHEKS
jgi:hypothetical protein